MKFVIAFLLCLTVYSSDCANILVTFPVPMRSHNILGVELTKAMAARGHNITFITPFASKEKNVNITEIVVEELSESKLGKRFISHHQKPTHISFAVKRSEVVKFNSTFVTMLKQIINMESISPSHILLENSKVQRLLYSNHSFDLVINDILISEALIVLGHHFKAPVIGVSTIGTTELLNMISWNSQPLAYVPSLFLPFSDEMTFLHRTLNTIVSTAFNLLATFVIYPSHAALIREKFPEAPPFLEMLHNVSLTLINADYSILETPRPYLPNMIPIGGFHVQPQTMPAELKEYLDDSKEGALLFSLGSNLKSSSLDAAKFEVILKTFAKFPQRFLWKFENSSLDVPENVRIMKWIPQRAVLGKVNGFNNAIMLC